jgi:hypothetical protein
MKKKSYFEKGDPFLARVLIILALIAIGVFIIFKYGNLFGGGIMLHIGSIGKRGQSH